MKKNLALFLLFTACAFTVYSQPANDNCASATTLSINSSLLCGQNGSNATLQSNECSVNYSGGGSPSSMWYRFTATNDSLVLNFIQTNSSCAPTIQVLGPYASGAGCYPTSSCTSNPPYYNFSSGYQGSGGAYYLLSNGDPGNHPLLKGLSIGSDYLIRIQMQTGGSCGSTWPQFCISINTPASNNAPSTASVMNQCGTSFSGTTNGGYWNNGGTAAPFQNLDGSGNADVSYVVNNISWYSFCSTNTVTCSWNVTFSVSNCHLSSPNAGSQLSVFTGSPTNLTNVWSSSASCGMSGNGQVPPGCSVTSSNFSIGAGACAYVSVDGFAGDACDYSLVLSNVSCPCNVVLPVDLLSFSAECTLPNRFLVKWETASETNCDYYTIETSPDGVNFYPLKEVKGSGTSASLKKYYISFADRPSGGAYYRLSQTDLNGTTKVYPIITTNGCESNKDQVNVFGYGSAITVTVNSSQDKNYNIVVMDTQGKVVLEKQEFFAAGIASITIPVDLNNGIYFLKVFNENNIVNRKVYLQK